MSPSPVNPVEKVKALATKPAEPWPLERIARSAHDALSRWQAARERLGIQFSFWPRAVWQIAPDFILSPELSSLAPSDNSRRSSVIRGFLAWEMCPLTRDIPNPLEPMLDIVHHGCGFSTEHGYIDVYAADGSKCGISMHRYAGLPDKPRSEQRTGDSVGNC